MKKIVFFLLLSFISFRASAHYIWLETQPEGKLNREHRVRVHFGEYTYGVIEKVSGDAFKGVSDFTLWLLAPNGEKLPLTVTPGEDFYEAHFVPTQNGTYTLALDNKNMAVLDYTQYDFGIFKPQYHAKAKVVVGSTVSRMSTSNTESIEIVDLSGAPFGVAEEVTLQVLFKGQPLAENEISIYVADLWVKKLTTDAEGKVSFKLPWDTKYTVEATYNEKVPGSFKGLDYEFIWHCATYCIPLGAAK
jgi:uncharacterized GH25 family protein